MRLLRFGFAAGRPAPDGSSFGIATPSWFCEPPRFVQKDHPTKYPDPLGSGRRTRFREDDGPKGRRNPRASDDADRTIGTDVPHQTARSRSETATTTGAFPNWRW